MNLKKFPEINKLTTLVREKTLSTIIGDWKSLMDCLYKNGKNELVIYGFDD